MTKTEIDLGWFRLTLGAGFVPNTLVFTGPETHTSVVRLAVLKQDIVFRPSIVVSLGDRFLAAAEQLDDYVAAQIRELESSRGYAERSRRAVHCADGDAGVLVHHLFDNDAGLRIEQLQLYRQLDRALLVVTATELAGEPFVARAEALRETLLSLRFPRPPA